MRNIVFSCQNFSFSCKDNPHALKDKKHQFSVIIWPTFLPSIQYWKETIPTFFRVFVLSVLLVEVRLLERSDMWYMYDRSYFSLVPRQFLDFNFCNHWICRGGHNHGLLFTEIPDFNVQNINYRLYLQQINNNKKLYWLIRATHSTP